MTRAIHSNKHRNLAGLMIASVFALAACGGGGGGGDHGGGGGGLATAFTKKAEAAGAAGSAGALFSAFSAEIRYQFLLMAADIKGSGRIKSVGFRYAGDLASAMSCPNTTIRMGATTVTTLSMTYDSNVNQGAGSSVIVLNNVTVSIPAGITGNYFNIDLATPFEYNGKDNLVVEVTRTSACTDTVPVQLPTVAYNGLTFLAAAGASTAVDGTPFLGAAHMQFAFAAGDNRQDFGGVTSNAFPFFDTNVIRQQTLYLPSEIQGSGPVTGVAFQTNAITVAGTYAYTLMLGHSTLTAFGITFANNYSGTPVTVANAVTNFTIPAGIPAGEWIWLPIPDGVFSYNGIDNLIVDITTNAATATNSQRITAGVGRRLWANPIAATGTVDVEIHHIALRFGGQVAVMSTGADSSDSFPFRGAGLSSKRQYLYRMSELGTGGSITGVACRLDQATGGTTLATNYANFEVVLGHTTSDTLGTTFATNMTDAATAFSGTYALAAGLRAGDWIDIPLSTPFTYDPTRNLVVQLSGDGGANSYSCDAKNDGVLYLSRHAFVPDRTAAVGSVNSFQNELKLTISK